MTESFFCTGEIGSTLYINYTLIKNLKKNNDANPPSPDIRNQTPVSIP